jgi:autophagy-related protein 2
MNFLSSLFSLPSLPALPTSYLPSLPSLPQNLQRRFLSFVLKRSLGHLVKAGALDPDRLEAQVVTGHVEVKGVELDEDVSPRPGQWSPCGRVQR